MADSADNNGSDKHRSNPPSDDYERRLSDLNKKLSKVRSTAEGNDPDKAASTSQSFSDAFRMTSELIAGPVVGTFIGWWLDNTVGTTPIFLLIFLVLGLGAGIRNIMRAAQQMQEKQNSSRNDDTET